MKTQAATRQKIFIMRLICLSHTAALFLVVLSVCLLSFANISFAKVEGFGAQPSWWNNDIGKDEIVLPGFDSIRVEGSTVLLGAARQYKWDGSVLPREIIIKGKPFVTNQSLIMLVNGKEYDLAASEVSISQGNGHHVDVNAVGSIESLLDFQVNTRIEYDGVAMVEVILSPKTEVNIQSLYYNAHVLDSEWTDALGFDHDFLGDRKKKVILESDYHGELLSSVAFIDGEQSFWWFIDESKGWHHKYPKKITSVKRVDGRWDLRQEIIDSDLLLTDQQHFSFNFLATPVKKNIGNIRRNRVSRGKSKVEGKYHGQNLWWIDAFSHQVLPYVNFSKTYPKKITEIDQSVYPGLFKNRRIQSDFKRNGVLRLPYFSAHVLNHRDPAYQQYKDLWEVRPRILWDSMKYDGPFSSKRNDAFLTHRAEGYTDYLLYRFDDLITTLGMEGLYFDQGGVRLSSSMQNGGWLDKSGKIHGASDVLALRSFHKRLATLFYLRGKEGLIVSHNSNTMIAPAYTFTTAMVQGEEFNHWLENYDYINSISLDELRSRMGGSAIGVPTLWLEVLFAQSNRLKLSNRPLGMEDKKTWHNSVHYKNAYLNFMTLALLHDMPTWSYAPVLLRNKIMKKIDWVEPETADFFGYWLGSREDFNDGLYYSYYFNKKNNRVLFVLSNLSDRNQLKPISHLISLIRQKHAVNCQVRDKKHNKNDLINVASKRFTLIALSCEKVVYAN